MLSANAVPYLTYGPLLDALRREAAKLTLRAGEEAMTRMHCRGQPNALPAPVPTPVLLRAMGVLAAIVTQSDRVARHIGTLPRLIEERNGTVMQKLELVFSVFAQHKAELATFYQWMDADLAAETRADIRAARRGESVPDLPSLYDDIAGRRPMILVAELCRDFGIATHTLPAEWLEPVSPDLRFVCARAAAASLRPARPRRAYRTPHLLDRPNR